MTSRSLSISLAIAALCVIAIVIAIFKIEDVLLYACLPMVSHELRARIRGVIRRHEHRRRYTLGHGRPDTEDD